MIKIGAVERFGGDEKDADRRGFKAAISCGDKKAMVHISDAVFDTNGTASALSAWTRMISRTVETLVKA